uniref:t-SNARE coiled-coil homology domain-containing protein n=1 Tax=Peronospora matthiolae TaxID=2874970 RepID=A0AAV1TS12_9STRA
MSFADYASSLPPTLSAATSHAPPDTRASLTLPCAQTRQAVESATLQLEQFQRQVLAVKRASLAEGAVDEDLHDRIRFACLLQHEIGTALAVLPVPAAQSLIKRKLCNDFAAISNQLEPAVARVSKREQAQKQARQTQQQHEDGPLFEAPLGTQAVESAELEREIAQNEALIEEREHDLHQIHQSVAQVNEIFRDLAALVQEQQGAIDDVDAHVHESLQQTQQGLKEVQKASDMQGQLQLLVGEQHKLKHLDIGTRTLFEFGVYLMQLQMHDALE